METPNTPRSIGRQPVFTEATGLDVLELYRTLGAPMALEAFCLEAYQQFLTPRVISTATMRKLLQGKLFPALTYPSGALFDYHSLALNRVRRGRVKSYAGQFDFADIRRRLREDLEEILTRKFTKLIREQIAEEIGALPLGGAK